MTIEEARTEIESVFRQELGPMEPLQSGEVGDEVWTVAFRVPHDEATAHVRYLRPAGKVLAQEWRRREVARCSGVIADVIDSHPSFDGEPAWSFGVRGVR